MTLAKALELFAKNVKGRMPTGYWEQNGQIIFQTKPVAMTAGLAAPAQYVVTADGKVYGTNPSQTPLNPSKMKKLPGLGKKR